MTIDILIGLTWAHCQVISTSVIFEGVIDFKIFYISDTHGPKFENIYKAKALHAPIMTSFRSN